MSGTTRTKSKDCAEVEGKTVVKGEGEDADVKVETDVESDKPIDVSVFVKRVDDGEKVETIAIGIPSALPRIKNSSHRQSYLQKSSKPTKAKSTSALLSLSLGWRETRRRSLCSSELLSCCWKRKNARDSSLWLLVSIGCSEAAGINGDAAVGFEDRFLQYTLPSSVSTCLTPSCSAYANAKDCCGEAQLKQDQCACKGGTCAWVNPEKKNGVYSWTCNDCGFDVKTCSCA